MATIGTHDQIVGLLHDRYGDRVDRIEFSIPVNSPADAEVMSGLIAELRR